MTLGSAYEIDYVPDALVKAIELAAIENGQNEVETWAVEIPVRRVLTTTVEARSHEEAVAQVYALFENDQTAAVESCASDLPEYHTDDTRAIPLGKASSCS